MLQLHDLQGDIVATASVSEGETKLLSTYNSTEFGVPNEGKTPPKYAWLGATGMSTETSFGSGVATQSGASYVPQVARDLQTAPVVPPGASPNGTPGTQYTATVSPESLKSAEEEATQLWQRAEAERQKAREREACLSAPLSCLTMGEDPLLKFELNISNTAALYELVQQVCAGGPGFEHLIAVLVALGGMTGSEGVLDSPQVVLTEFGGERVAFWLEKLEDGLYNCLAEMVTTFAGGNKGCRVEFDSISLRGYEGWEGLEEPEFGSLPAVWFCQYGECYPPKFRVGTEPGAAGMSPT